MLLVIDGDDSVHCQIDHTGQPRLAFTKCFLGLLVLGHISRDYRTADDLSVGTLDRRKSKRDNDRLAVLPHPFRFKAIDVLTPLQLFKHP